MRILVLVTAILGACMACRGNRSMPHGTATARVPAPPSPPTTPIPSFRALSPVPAGSFADALEDAEYVLTRGYLPGTGVASIESISYVSTSVAAVSTLLAEDPGTWYQPERQWQRDDGVWVFVEYGGLHSVSIHGGSAGEEGTQVVVVGARLPDEPLGSGANVHNSFLTGAVDVSRLGVVTNIPPGEDAAIDGLRVADDLIVHSTAEAMAAVVRFLPHVLANVSQVAYVETTAARSAQLTGVGADGLPSGTKAWLFELTGDFQGTCGGDFHDGQPASRLLVVEGRAAPYVVRAAPASYNASPVAELAAFGAAIAVDPGESPGIDQFRKPVAEINATATARAMTAVLPC